MRKGIAPRPIEYLTCKVYRGLTLEQEKILRSDHIGLAALLPWERYCNVIDLYDAGETLKSIVSLTGIKQATVNRWNGIHDMDPIVEEEHFKSCHKIPNMGLGQKELIPLHSAWIADRDAMLVAMRRGELSESNVFLPLEERISLAENGRYRLFRAFGEKSQALWDSFVEAYEASGDASTAEPTIKARKRKDIDDASQSMHAIPSIAKALKWAKGEDVNLQYLYMEEVQRNKDQAMQYDELCKYKQFVSELAEFLGCNPSDLNKMTTMIVDMFNFNQSNGNNEDIIINEEQLALPNAQ
jgi:hypothetical protein